MKVNLGKIIVNSEMHISDITVKEETNIGNVKLDYVKEFPELEDLEIIPTTEEQNFKSSKYGYDNVKVKRVTSDIDKDIQAENIKKGINILGVDGSYEGIDTTNATATANDILKGKTAYANNQEITGTIEEYDGSFEGSASGGIKITNASYLFYYGARIDYMNELLALCESITDMQYMFYFCESLTDLDLSSLDTSKVTNMQYVFNYCSKLTDLDLSNFNTNNVTNMKYMFSNCKKLTSLNLSNFNTSNVTSMDNMFEHCNVLTELNLSGFNTSKVTSMNRMFNGCNALTELDLSGFDASNVIKVGTMFDWCRALTKFKCFKNLGKGYTQKSNNYNNYKLDFSYSSLEYESLMDIINNLYDLNLTYDVANGGTLYRQSLVLGSTNLAKLTEEEIAIATNKGWNVT